METGKSSENVPKFYLSADHIKNPSTNAMSQSLHANNRVDVIVHILMFTPRFSFFPRGLNLISQAMSAQPLRNQFTDNDQ